MEAIKLVSRRNFLKGSAVVGGLLAAGGFWRAIDAGVFNSGEGLAYSAWNTSAQGMEEIVRAATLAANSHNTQPWRFDIGDTYIHIFADKARNIGTADPFLREMHASLGCALENLVIAAAAKGYSSEIEYFPDSSQKNHIAKVNLSEGKTVRSELYDAIPKRHMNRAPYDTERTVSKDMLQFLHKLNEEKEEVKLFLFDSSSDKKMISEAMFEATEAFIADQDQVNDDAKWMRQTWDAIEAHKDGITLDAQGLSPFMRVVAKMLPPLSVEQNNAFWLKTVKEKQLPTAAAFGFIAVRDLNNYEQVIKAGQLWQRIHLFGTAKGLALQVLNQLSERRDREISLGIETKIGKKLNGIINDSNWQSVIQFRLGYPTLQGLPSPRRPVSEVVI
ncbi:twin-arginine translocation signal domain-containing protein [Bacillus cytotoxicus]|nr:twin-arginine translocation signal domain-containing protein [Bacillus cytotoxicus]